MIEEKEYKYYTCKYDTAFKEVFLSDDNELLKVLLESILKIRINKIEIKNSELKNQSIHSRKKLVDALIYTDKDVINIEVNTSTEDYVKPRNFAYISRAYANYVLVGDHYSEKVKFIQINLSYNLTQKEYLRIYKVMDKAENTYINNFLIYEFNMDKYVNLWYTKNQEKIEENKYLIMLNLPKEDLLKLSEKDKVVLNYMEKLNSVNEDPRFQSYMSREEDDRKILNSLKEEYYEKGEVKGKEEGIKEGKREIIKSLYDSGLTIDKISKLTNSNKEEIESYLQ